MSKTLEEHELRQRGLMMNQRKNPTPIAPGFYWAKLVHPHNMPEGEDWVSPDWEVVQVIDNNGDGDERLGVFVGGVAPMQWVEDFVWGPQVTRPAEIGSQP